MNIKASLISMNQKGFIQIPLLIIVIASILTASIGTGVVLYKQGKLASLTANISEVFKGTGEVERSQTESWPTEGEPAIEEPIKEELVEEPAVEEGLLETEAREKFNLKKPEEKVETILSPEEIDPCAGINCAVCRDCVNGRCIAKPDGYNNCGSGCQRCLNGSCQDYDTACSSYQFCDSGACVNNCGGIDISCGRAKPCTNCNNKDSCIGNDYYDYYCSGASCAYRSYPNDPRCVSCNSHTSYSCYDNGVYWYDSCGERKEMKKACGPFQYCSGGECYNNCQGTDDSCGFTSRDSCVNCNNSDGWIDSVSSYFPYCDGNKSCTDQKQEYRDYFCSSVSCSYSVTETRTNKSCNECGSSKFCSGGFCLNKPADEQCEWIWQGMISGFTVTFGPGISCTAGTNGSTGYIMGVAPKAYDGSKYLSTSIGPSSGSVVHRFLCRCQ